MDGTVRAAVEDGLEGLPQSGRVGARVRDLVVLPFELDGLLAPPHRADDLDVLQRTREYVEIVRSVWRREKPVEFKGQYYQIPYAGADATGLGKPLKSILHGRADSAIHLAALGPRNEM